MTVGSPASADAYPYADIVAVRTYTHTPQAGPKPHPPRHAPVPAAGSEQRSAARVGRFTTTHTETEWVQCPSELRLAAASAHPMATIRPVRAPSSP